MSDSSFESPFQALGSKHVGVEEGSKHRLPSPGRPVAPRGGADRRLDGGSVAQLQCSGGLGKDVAGVWRETRSWASNR